LFFERWVGVLVDAGGLDVFVAEPQGDGREVDPAGSEEHRVGVPERVWADWLVGQRWAAAGRGGDVLGQ